MDGYGRQAGATVMVVDDVSASRYAMGAVLRRAGHDVVPVASAGEALSELDVRLRAGALPDVALVDVGLPDMSGFELCRRVKARPSTAALPVVHFSATAMEAGDRCRGLDVGADAYLTVPAEPREIQAVVRSAVRRARRRTAAEALAHRLTLLSEAIFTVQTARCLGELADAAAAGAARLSGTPAVVFVIGPDGEPHWGCSPSSLHLPRSHGFARPAGTPTSLPATAPHVAAARLITRIAEGRNGRTGVHSTVVPASLWPAGFFRPGIREEAHLLLASGQEGRAHVCIATPACRAAVPATPSRGAGLYRHAAPPRGATSHDGPADNRRHIAAPPVEAAPEERLAQATALAAEPLLMYQAERDIALTLQHSFLPQPYRLPALPGVDVVVRYVPASRQAEIGGDFYAALRTEGGVLTAVGDVVGHSLDAATVMVEIRHALRAYCVEESDPGALAARLDRMLQHYHPDITATVCLALLDPATGRTRIANAGHLPPLIVRDAGDAEYVPVDGPLLGLALDRPEPSELVLARGDRLLMVTDGLIETRGIDLATSMEQLRTAAAEAPAGLDALCDTLLGCFGRGREDDIAMLALRLG
ncbi:fused response regulator/phosphatase [Streptomyces sp. DT2A-34]|uniref:fused response regulator/phosphatase n=1 Tax=Streptomyces sp. DT2A-34 TaxID=3051182 RepID=UPI00265C3660|nr:fused response regulator/phosphatase [Streptomyces sp. DT2A-34]MDO0915500.1 fused response regulator/phosphatase [Streptomyces sp. DT2A-34]